MYTFVLLWRQEILLKNNKKITPPPPPSPGPSVFLGRFIWIFSSSFFASEKNNNDGTSQGRIGPKRVRCKYAQTRNKQKLTNVFLNVENHADNKLGQKGGIWIFQDPWNLDCKMFQKNKSSVPSWRRCSSPHIDSSTCLKKKLPPIDQNPPLPLEHNYFQNCTIGCLVWILLNKTKQTIMAITIYIFSFGRFQLSKIFLMIIIYRVIESS